MEIACPFFNAFTILSRADDGRCFIISGTSSATLFIACIIIGASSACLAINSPSEPAIFAASPAAGTSPTPRNKANPHSPLAAFAITSLKSAIIGTNPLVSCPRNFGTLLQSIKSPRKKPFAKSLFHSDCV